MTMSEQSLNNESFSSYYGYKLLQRHSKVEFNESVRKCDRLLSEALYTHILYPDLEVRHPFNIQKGSRRQFNKLHTLETMQHTYVELTRNLLLPYKFTKFKTRQLSA